MTAFSAPDPSRLDTAARALRLLDAPGLGPHRLYKLLETHGSLTQVERYLRTGPKVPERIREHAEVASMQSYRQIMQETVERGDDFKLWSDHDYPANLGLWGARPAVLFFRGDLSHLGQRSLALVGRVDPSAEGEAAAHRFARMCVDHDITVVSGLAKGIDGASHRAALSEPPGYTYAVVGHGLDFAYPAENRDLYAAIPQRGAVISQFPLGVGPQRWTFPARNEAMCTLALGTVIVEGKPGCGSIIQAEFSFKHGRPVFLLSRNLRSGETTWAEELVAKGAHVIEHFDQALELVQQTMGELWSETSEITSVQPELFDMGEVAGDHDTRARSEPARARTEPAVKKCALLFDIDGVIADSRETTAAALAGIILRHTGREVDPAAMDVAGAPHKLLAAHGVRSAWDVYKAEYDSAFAEASATHMTTFTEVVEALRGFRRAGIRTAAITAQPRRRADHLLPHDVQSLFDLYYTHNETRGKKDVGIRRAIETLGVEARNAAYIGDTVPDLEAARSAGVRGVAVGWGFTDPAALEKHPHDLMLRHPGDLGVETVRELFDI